MSLFDENAAILTEMENDGSDLRPSRKVDFSHVFPTRVDAEAYAEAATRYDFETTVEQVDRADDPWEVTASKDMIPSAENITSAEEWLDTLARQQGGMADGWGFERV